MASKEEELELATFLKENEWRNLYLAHFYQQSKENRKLLMQLILAWRGDELVAIAAMDHEHRLLIEGMLNTPQEYQGILAYLRLWPQPYCFIGNSRAIQILEKLGHYRASMVSVDYFLMSMNPRSKKTIELPKFFEFKESSADDFNKLLSLEIGYHREEVMVTKHHYMNDNSIALFLKQRLVKEECYHLEYANRALSKLSVNIKGVRYDQIAGVYTPPLLRGRGLAKILFSHFLMQYQDNHRLLVLFVKQNNPTAIGLYQSLGFQQQGDFRITYLV